jgi:hypothetical protein
MNSDLNEILGEQQAVLALLSGRLLDEAGHADRQSFDAFARALFAHLSVLSGVVLPAMDDAQARSQLSATSELASGRLAHAVVLAQSNMLDKPNIDCLTAATTGLIAIERAVVPLSMLALPVTRQQQLAASADEVFALTIGPNDGEIAASRSTVDPAPL